MRWKCFVWIRWQPSVIMQSTTLWLLLLCFGLAILLYRACSLILTCFMLPCVKCIIFCISAFHLWNCVSVHCASVATFMQLRWLQYSWSDWSCRWRQWRPNGRRLGYLIWVLWLPVNWCTIRAGGAPWRDCGIDETWHQDHWHCWKTKFQTTSLLYIWICILRSFRQHIRGFVSILMLWDIIACSV